MELDLCELELDLVWVRVRCGLTWVITQIGVKRYFNAFLVGFGCSRWVWHEEGWSDLRLT